MLFSKIGSPYSDALRLLQPTEDPNSSRLFTKFVNLLGIKHISTTAYHPCSNGLVERFHRQLKYALTASTSARTWVDKLPFVMLALRNTIKLDLKCTSAELVFGKPTTLPGQIFHNVTNSTPTSYFVADLKKKMTDIIYTSTRVCKKPFYVPTDLQYTEYVFLRRDAVRKPLTPNYTGPHLVISRTPKYFTIDVAGKQNTVSIDRLKPAYLQSDDVSQTPPKTTTSEQTNTQTKTTDRSPSTQSTRTKPGRHVHWPTKLQTYITY